MSGDADVNPILVCTFLLLVAGCASTESATPGTPPSDGEHALQAIIAGPFRIEFRDLRKDRYAGPPIQGVVHVTIRKDDAAAGPVTWSADHREGEVLGWSRTPDQAISTHLVHSPILGRVVPVDFDTGITLLEMTPRWS